MVYSVSVSALAAAPSAFCVSYIFDVPVDAGIHTVVGDPAIVAVPAVSAVLTFSMLLIFLLLLLAIKNIFVKIIIFRNSVPFHSE
jgi:hypothetical protein